MLLELETFSPNIWECACGEGHLSKVFEKIKFNTDIQEADEEQAEKEKEQLNKIEADKNEYLDKFQYTLTQKKSNSWNIVDNDKLFNSPTEAYEAAIKHCLEKII